MYSAPFTGYLVHCICARNGTTTSTNANYEFDEDPAGFTNNIFIYNCIGYKPRHFSAYESNIEFAYYWKASGWVLNLDSDYNCWRQRDTEIFCEWSLVGESPGVEFTYVQGPGSVSTNWYLWYDYNTTPPAVGTAHFHCDAHSVTVEPPWVNEGSHNYALTTHLPGANLSGKSWYIADMGKDANGITRTSWDMGAYEYQSSSVSAFGIVFS